MSTDHPAEPREPDPALLNPSEPEIADSSDDAHAPLGFGTSSTGPANADRAQRFSCGSLDAWRAAFFVSLGWSAGACGGDVAPTVSEHLQCEGDSPMPGRPGLWRCSNGIVHRPEPIADSPCADCVGPSIASRLDQCDNDADCVDGALCVESHAVVSTHIECRATIAEVGSPFFACQTPTDRCGVSAQCPGGLCAFDDGARQCFASAASRPCGEPGRPFLVGDEVRFASARVGAGWCDSRVAAAVDPLDSSRLARAVEHFQQAALLEHASIAAFARFTLQLLELGAPASFCRGAQDAMRDEIVHAQLCFTLASRYARQPIAPGPLSMSGALAPASLEDVTRSCVLEGCIGETLAALEAAEALAGTTDPEVRAALERIAEDERRHAELAFRFVAWALEQSPATSLRRTLAAVLDAALAGGGSGCSDDDVVSLGDPLASNGDAILERHGIISEGRRRSLRRAALEQVVAPCVRRLLVEASPRCAQTRLPNQVAAHQD